jgi:hypothetical protein
VRKTLAEKATIVAPYRANMLAIDRFGGSCIRTSASRRSNETVTADLAAVA